MPAPKDKKKGYLQPENCNKAMCKTCIFKPENADIVTTERLNEIKAYLLGSSSHECHTTNKTCYGALEFQATMFYRLGIITEPTVNCFLDTAAQYIN